jgi:hypothetical protein
MKLQMTFMGKWYQQYIESLLLSLDNSSLECSQYIQTRKLLHN